MKVIRKMTLYWWTHFFWVTAFSTHMMVLSSPIPFSSLETISTSLKSALVQNDNSFQQTGDQQKITSGKSVVPLTFETSDSDDLFGVADQINAENIAKNSDWLTKHEENKSLNETASSTEKPKSISVKLEQSQSIHSSADVIASVNESNNTNINNKNNVNSTNASQITTIATTMLTNLDESNNR